MKPGPLLRGAKVAVSRSIFSSGRRLAESFLGVRPYVALCRWAYPLFWKARRWPDVRFQYLGGNVLRVTDGATGLLFLGKTRVNRYLWPNGVVHALRMVGAKYTDGSHGVLVERGDTVIDVGANVGEFSLFASQQGAAVVHALEPDPDTFELLARNVRSDVTIRTHAAAANRETGTVKLYVSNADADSSIIEPQKWTSVAAVASVTLDDFCTSAELKHIDFLKVEAEGAEPQVLDGALRTLSRTRKVAVDCGPERRGQPTAQQVGEMLTLAGFHLSRRGNILFGRRDTLVRS